MKKTILIFLLILTFLLSGCNEMEILTESPDSTMTQQAAKPPTPSPTPHTQLPVPSSNPSFTLTPTQTPEPEIKVNYILSTIHNDMLLMPQSGDDLYDMIEKNEKYIFWTVTEWNYIIKPAELKVNKIGEITGKRYYESNETTYHIYKIELGDLVFYDRFDRPLDEQYKIRKIAGYIHGGKYNGWDISNQKTRDYTIMLLFDDLYAIDKEDGIRMITSRNIGGFNYESIEKIGVGDIIPWVWVDKPYASQLSNWLCYLTSREGNFNNIWYISIDNGTEGKLTDDIAFRLYGTNSMEIAYMINSDSLIPQTMIRKLGGEAIPVSDDIRNVWSEKGALVLQGDDFLIIDMGNFEIRLDDRYEGFHPFYNNYGIWLSSRFEYGQPRTFIMINEGYWIFIFNDVTAKPIDEWYNFFRHSDDYKVHVDDIGEYGIEITRPEVNEWD